MAPAARRALERGIGCKARIGIAAAPHGPVRSSSSDASASGGYSAVTIAWPMPSSSTRRTCPAFHFLVHRHELLHARAPEPRRIDRQPRGGEQLAYAQAIGARQAPGARGEFRGKHEPGGDRLAMQDSRHKPAPASMAWPKVWPRFSSARRPCSRSSSTTIAALIAQARRIASSSAAGSRRAAFRHVDFEPGEEPGVGDQRRLDDLREPCPQLPVRQRRERVGVGDDGRRLVEGADQVLAARMIDAGLAADGGVHHARAASSAAARSRRRAGRRPPRSPRCRRSRRRRARAPGRPG